MNSRRRTSSIQNFFRFLFTCFSVNLRGAREYKINFWVQALGMLLNNLTFIVFWNLFLDRTGPLGGYELKDILFLWGMGAASFGLGHILFGNVRHMGEVILRGELDIYLLQPKPVLVNLAASRTELASWGDLVFGLGILVYLSWDQPLILGLMLVFVFSGSMITMSLLSLVQSLTFWVGSTSGAARAFLELLISATLYPQTLLEPQYRWILWTILPTMFISFLPLQIYRQLDWPLIPLVLGAAVVFTLLAGWVFYRGLRRYESGNLMGTRL